jgi:hypothetical protein
MEELSARLQKLGALAPARPGEPLENNQVFSSPEALILALAYSPHFRRDTPWGRIFHPWKLSYREISASDSLHVVFDGRNVSAHVDQRSPLNVDPGQRAHYSTGKVITHNLSGFVGNVARVFRRDPRHARTVELSPGATTGGA